MMASMAKRILQIYYRGEFIGFVVVTFKHGGTLKTGPVILLDQYRDRSLGQQLRSFLHAAAPRGGLRKVYCTTNVNNAPGVQYLLRSSYRVEAHLSKQYHRS